MNYINLTLGGKERGAKVGLQFLGELQRGENLSTEEILNLFTTPQIDVLPKYLYYSLVTNCNIKREEVDFTMQDVYDWVDEDGASVGSEIIKYQGVLMESIRKAFIPKDAIEEGKQKPTKKVSTPTSGSKK